jgi:hypothetical protein
VSLSFLRPTRFLYCLFNGKLAPNLAILDNTLDFQIRLYKPYIVQKQVLDTLIDVH